MLSLRRIPFRNIRTHAVRTIILVILTFSQTVCVFTGSMVMTGMRQETALVQDRLGADVLVYPTEAFTRIDKKHLLMQGTPVEVCRDRSILSKMEYCDGIAEVTYQIYLKGTKADGEDLWIVGYEPDKDFVITPWLEGGRNVSLQEGSLAVGSKVDVSEDGTVEIFGRKWPAGARLSETGSSLDTAVFVPVETLEQMIDIAAEAGIDAYSDIDTESDFSAALIRVTDKNQAEGVLNWINIYVRKVTAVKSEETLTQTASGVRGASGTVAVIAALAWVVLLIALGITQSILMKERIREIFVWHSIGASRELVNRVMLSEALIVYLIGAAAGALAAGIIFRFLGNLILPGIVPALPDLFLSGMAGMAVTVAAGLISSAVTLRNASKKLNRQMLLTV